MEGFNSIKSSVEHVSPISKRWKRATVFGNLAIGCFELLTGNTSSLAVAVDGIHNLGDAVTYNQQSNDLIINNSTPDSRMKRRKIFYWTAAATSGVISAKAGYDLSEGSSDIASNASVFAAGGSLLFNTALFARLKRGVTETHSNVMEYEDCHREDEITKHFLYLDIPSAGLALDGVLAQKPTRCGARSCTS